MKPLIDRIRKAAEFDIQDKASHELFEAMPQDTYRSMFIKGARYQHAKDAWRTEALVIAVTELKDLQKYVAYNGDSWVRENATNALDKIAALVPKGEK
jgi:hypothetical protein